MRTVRNLGLLTFVVTLAAPAIWASTTTQTATAESAPTSQASAPKDLDEDPEFNDLIQQLTAHALEPGYGQVVVDNATGAIDVYWKGDAPASVVRLVGDQLGGTAHVNLVGAPYSSAEFEKAGAAVFRLSREKYGLGGVQVTLGRKDLSGLQVQVLAKVVQNLTDVDEAEFQRAAGMPVDIVATDGKTRLASGGRWHDAAPYRAGAALVGPITGTTNASYCSSGFSVVRNTTGKHYLLSAAHCVVDDYSGLQDVTTVKNGDLVTIAGSAGIAYHGSQDTALIEPSTSTAPKTVPLSYAGPWYAVTSYATIVAQGNAAVGENMCNSGAMTGIHCGRNVASTTATFTCYTVSSSCYGFATSGTGVGGGIGDSGGPIYKATTGGYAARGIITSERGDEDCGDTAYPTSCANVVYSPTLGAILTSWDVSIDVP